MEDRYSNYMPEVLKLSFLAPTGYGKSTAAEYICRKFGAKNLKLAKPLYDMQSAIYAILGENLCGRQDGELLQFLGNKIQKNHPYFLADSFYKQMCEMKNLTNISILTNDDCRPHNYPFLKQMGFLFVKIEGIFRNRNDITNVDSNNAVEWRESIPYDFVVNNSGTKEEFEVRLKELVIKIEENRNEEVLYYTN